MTSAAFHPSAALEFRAAANYYDDGFQSLGDQFIDEVERVVTLLCEHPQLGWRRARLPAMPAEAYLTVPPDCVCEVQPALRGRCAFAAA